MKEKFRVFAAKVSTWAGSPLVFVGAILVIALWALSGPAAGYSDTWQLIINTGTTIVTFLMVFLIQNTQNRDSKAMHLKLDELIRSHSAARSNFVSLEDISDAELIEIANEFKKLHEQTTQTPAMHKLHEKIEAEKTKRLSLKEATIQAVNAVKAPFNRTPSGK